MSLTLEQSQGAVRFEFTGLASYSRNEVELSNWLCRFLPGGAQWRDMVREVFGGLIEKRVASAIHLVQTSEIEQKKETREYSFEKSEVGIGRNPENDVVLPAKAIGRSHARIFAEGGSFYIEDLGSSLGTWVNQKRLEPKQPYPLNNGDVIGTFPYTLTFDVKSVWEPETQVDFQSTPAQQVAWDDFSLAAPIGSVHYDLAIHPSLGAVRMQADRSFLVKLIARVLREQPEGMLLASDSGVIEFLLLSILERVNGRMSMPFQFSLQQPRRDPAFGSLGLSFSLTLGMSDIWGSFRIFVPWDVIAGMRKKAPATAPPPLLEQVSWPLQLSAGSVEFTPEELATIEAGDVVLYAPDPLLLFPPNLRGKWPGIGWKGEFVSASPRQFKVDRYYEERSLLMGDDAKVNENNSSAAPDLSQLPVRLHVVLGEVDLSLAEISSMTGGTLLELDKGKNEPVHLAVNGRILGTGELVEIDGKLGVRVTGWSAA